MSLLLHDSFPLKATMVYSNRFVNETIFDDSTLYVKVAGTLSGDPILRQLAKSSIWSISVAALALLCLVLKIHTMNMTTMSIVTITTRSNSLFNAPVVKRPSLSNLWRSLETTWMNTGIQSAT